MQKKKYKKYMKFVCQIKLMTGRFIECIVDIYWRREVYVDLCVIKVTIGPTLYHTVHDNYDKTKNGVNMC